MHGKARRHLERALAKGFGTGAKTGASYFSPHFVCVMSMFHTNENIDRLDLVPAGCKFVLENK